jgi:hypothetical protein
MDVMTWHIYRSRPGHHSLVSARFKLGTNCFNLPPYAALFRVEHGTQHSTGAVPGLVGLGGRNEEVPQKVKCTRPIYAD